jgi:hypothetical protein
MISILIKFLTPSLLRINSGPLKLSIGRVLRIIIIELIEQIIGEVQLLGNIPQWQILDGRVPVVSARHVLGAAWCVFGII